MKKTALVLLATLSLLCLLFLVSCGKTGEQILASQPAETDSVSSLPTGSAAPETKQTEPAQTEPEQTEPAQPAVCAHVFGEWETVTEPTCESDGVRRRTCSLCGQTESETLLGGHSYGALFNEVPPTLFRDGTLAHYECSVCRKLFDEDKNEIATAAVPKRSSDLSICVNGTPTPLNLVEKNENSIVWSLSGLSVAKGDVITLCETGNAAVEYDYIAQGNVDGKNKEILNTAAVAEVSLVATSDGLTLSIGGEAAPVFSEYVLSVAHTNGNQTPSMAKNPDNAKEVCIKGLTVAANSYLMVSEVESDNPSNSKQYASLADTDDSVAVSYGTLILVKAAGTYDVFFNTETKTVRIAATVQS